MIRLLSILAVTSILIVTPVHNHIQQPHTAMMPRPLYNGHYWFGVQYSGSSGTATSVAVSMSVPQDKPENNFYYVVLSVFDNNNSYDQLGYVNDYGNWKLVYSTTSSCANTFYYQYNTTPTLQPGLTYNFTMNISSGVVTFSIPGYWQQSVATGGTDFSIADTYTCNSSTYYDFTEYEEIYSVTYYAPPYQIIFGYTYIDNTLSMQWSKLSVNAPSWLVVSTTSSSVVITNEPFILKTSLDYIWTPAYGIAKDTYTGQITLTIVNSSSTLNVCIKTYFTNIKVSFSTTCGTPSYNTTMTYSLQYLHSASIGIEVYDNSGNYTRVTLNTISITNIGMEM